MQTPYHNRYLDLTPEATRKFKDLDQIMFRWSPYLTQEESYKILDTMEIWAKSKLEGNFTLADNYQYLKDTLGEDRFLQINMMEELDLRTDKENLLKCQPK